MRENSASAEYPPQSSGPPSLGSAPLRVPLPLQQIVQREERRSLGERDCTSLCASFAAESLQTSVFRCRWQSQLCQQGDSRSASANQELTTFYADDGHKSLFAERDGLRHSESLRRRQGVFLTCPFPRACQFADTNWFGRALASMEERQDIAERRPSSQLHLRAVAKD